MFQRSQAFISLGDSAFREPDRDGRTRLTSPGDRPKVLLARGLAVARGPSFFIAIIARITGLELHVRD
jgi:hypothetical protein